MSENRGRANHLGADSLGYLGNIFFYSGKYLSYSGLILSLFLVTGAIVIIKKEKKFSIPLFFGFVYLLIMSKLSLHWERWALPVYISPLLISSYGMYFLYDKISVIKKLKTRYIYVAMLTTFILISISNLLINSAGILLGFTLKDTRFTLYEIIKTSGIITKENSIYEGYTPFEPGGCSNIYSKFYNQEYIHKKYVIVSSYMYKRYFKEKERYKDQVDLYNKIFSLNLVTAIDSSYNFPNSFFEPLNLIYGIRYFIYYSNNKSKLLVGPDLRIYGLY
jgi:hypothetical protein